MTEIITLFGLVFGFSKHIDTTGRAMIYLIWCLFVLGVIDLVFYCIMIKYEKIGLKIVMNRFNHIPNPTDEDINMLKNELIGEPLPHPPGIVNKLASFLRQKWIPATENRIKEIASIRERGGEINHDALAEILGSRHAMKAGFVRYLLSSLVILGLMGTSWGLGKCIANIPVITKLQSEEVTVLLGSLSKSFGGMSTAFATTLAGLFSTLILAFLYYRFNRYQTSFLTELEDFTTTSLIPTFFPKKEVAILKLSDTFKGSADTMSITSKMLAEASILMTSRLDQLDGFARNFGEATTTLVEGMKDMTNIRHYIDKIGEINTNLKELLTETTLLSLQKESVEIKDIISRFEISLQELSENLNSTIKTTNEEFSKNLDGILEENRHQVEKIFSVQKELTDTLQRIVDEFNRKAGQEEKQGEILKDLSQNIKELNGFLSKMAVEEKNRMFIIIAVIAGIIFALGFLFFAR
ncbi:MAG: MotA/TolQ/ExbB proton channel family protein [bacterium]